MSYAGQLVLYGAMVLTPWGLNALAGRKDFAQFADAINMSAVLLLVWVVTNAIAFCVGPPESKALHPLIDLFAMGIVVQSVVTDAKAGVVKQWKVALATLFAAQIALHGAFWTAWWAEGHILRSDLGQSVYSRYLWMNGIIWTVELVAAGWPGGRYVAGRLLARVRARGRGAAHPNGGGL